MHLYAHIHAKASWPFTINVFWTWPPCARNTAAAAQAILNPHNHHQPPQCCCCTQLVNGSTQFMQDPRHQHATKHCTAEHNICSVPTTLHCGAVAVRTTFRLQVPVHKGCCCMHSYSSHAPLKNKSCCLTAMLIQFTQCLSDVPRNTTKRYRSVLNPPSQLQAPLWWILLVSNAH